MNEIDKLFVSYQESYSNYLLLRNSYKKLKKENEKLRDKIKHLEDDKSDYKKVEVISVNI